MKRIISILLSCVLIIAAICANGCEAYAKTSGTYKYKTLKNNTVELTDYLDETPSTLVIPSKIDGKKVTKIGRGFCSYSENVKKLIVPNTVKEIKSNAFEGCRNLKEIIIPDSVKYIDDFSFCRCNKLENITLSKKLKKLGLCVFNITKFEEKHLKKVNNHYIRKEIYINNYLLATPYNNEALRNYKIKRGTSLIAGGAISGVKNLTIPSSVKYIDDNAFAPNGASKIRLSKKNKHFVVKNQVLYTKDMSKLIFCANADIESFTVPKSVKRICPNAFNGCKKLKKIVLNNGLKTIGDNAFLDCLSLKTIKIPKTVTKIGENAVGTRYSQPDEIYDEGNYTTVDGCRIIGYKGSAIESYILSSTEQDAYAECFIAVPSAPKLSLKAMKKGFAVKYSKVICSTKAYAKYLPNHLPQFEIRYKEKAEADGYQIRYTKSGKSKTVTYNSSKETSRKIKGLNKGKYKVKVRAFKTERERRVYSDWSKSKTIYVN